MAPATRAIIVFTQGWGKVVPAPTTTLTAVAAPRKAPGMNDSAGTLAWSTMNRAATPTRTDRTGRPPPNRREASSARKAHTTPERLEAMVLLSPVVFPPAAKKHPQATIPAHTGSAATPSAT